MLNLTLPVVFALLTVGAEAQVRLRISNETAPAGGVAQFRVWLVADDGFAGIAKGSLSMTFDSAVFGTVTQVAAFSSALDAGGYTYVNGNTIHTEFSSASGTIGASADLPIYAISVAVLPGAASGGRFPVTLGPGSNWTDAGGTPVLIAGVDRGSLTVGANLFVSSVTPGGGMVNPGDLIEVRGGGFGPDTVVMLGKGVSTSTQFVNAGLINFVVNDAVNLTGLPLILAGYSGQPAEYRIAFPSVADVANVSQRFPAVTGIQPMIEGSGVTAARMFGGASSAVWIDGLAMLNPFAVPVTVVFEGVPAALMHPQPDRIWTFTVPPNSVIFPVVNQIVSATAIDNVWILASSPVVLVGYIEENTQIYGEPRFLKGPAYYSYLAPEAMPAPAVQPTIVDGGLSWSWQLGTTPPPPATFTIAESVVFTDFDVEVSGTGAPLVDVRPLYGQAPGTITITPKFDTADIGNFTASVKVTPRIDPALAGLVPFVPAYAPITLMVTSAPWLLASSTTLHYFLPSNSMTESVAVTSNGTPTWLSVTVGNCDGGKWLSVTPSSGGTPATLQFTVDPAVVKPQPNTPLQCTVTLEGPWNKVNVGVKYWRNG